MGLFSDVPVVPRKPWGVICLVSNILPGFGTMIAAGNQESVKHFIIGLLQFLLFWTVIMWVWSIVMGVQIFLNSEHAAPATASAPARTATAAVSSTKKASKRKSAA